MMKQITFTLMFILFSGIVFAQQQDDQLYKNEHKHEMAFDALEFSIFNKIEFSYNYILTNSESIGIDVAFLPGNSKFWGLEDNYPQFIVAVNYKHYFSKKYAAGFYIEPFLQYINGHTYDGPNTLSNPGYYLDYHSMSIGFGAGYKFMLKRNWFIDVNTGLSKKLFDFNEIDPYKNTQNFIPHIGIKFGKRF